MGYALLVGLHRPEQVTRAVTGFLMLLVWAHPARAERCDDCRFDTGFDERACFAKNNDPPVKIGPPGDDGVIRLEESIILAVWPSPPALIDVSVPAGNLLRLPGTGEAVFDVTPARKATTESWHRYVELRERFGKLGAEARWQQRRFGLDAAEPARAPAPRETLAVAVIPLSRTQDGAELLGIGARHSKGALQECFRGTAPAESPSSGEVTMLLRMTAEGRVIEVRPTRDTQPVELGACLSARLQNLAFPRAWDGGATSYLLRIHQRDGRSPVEEDSESPRRSSFHSRDVPRGFYGHEPPGHPVKRIVSSAMVGFRACYTRALRRDPTLEGHAIVRFVIGGDGRVVSSRVRENTLPPEIGECVSDRIGDLRFSPPEGGNVPQTLRLLFRHVP